MGKRRNFLKLIAVLSALTLCIGLSACASKDAVTEISLGEGLPAVHTEVPYHEVAADDGPDDVRRYTAEENGSEDLPDICVYSEEKKTGVTLESFGMKRGEEHGVFCDMIERDGADAAVLNFYQDENHLMVQEYIYEGKNCFVLLDYCYRTKKEDLAESGLSFRLINGYIGSDSPESDLLYEKSYSIDNDDLPDISVCQFRKKNFSERGLGEKLFGDGLKVDLSEYSGKGLSPGSLIELYRGVYDLKKGEMIRKNGLEIAFIGYVDKGVFYVRSFIDRGSDIVMLGCEKEADKFRHMTNAFLDSIEEER